MGSKDTTKEVNSGVSHVHVTQYTGLFMSLLYMSHE